MSGLEIIVLVGAGIYISKKVKENKAKKRLAREAAITSEHGEAHVIEDGEEVAQHRRYLNRSQPDREEEALPLYMAPEGPPPPPDTADGKWSDEIHLPTYDETSEGSGERHEGESDALSRRSSSYASSSTSPPSESPSTSERSSSPTHLSPETAVKKHHRFFKRSNRSKSEVHTEES